MQIGISQRRIPTAARELVSNLSQQENNENPSEILLLTHQTG